MIQIWDNEILEGTEELVDEYISWKAIEDILELFIVDKRGSGLMFPHMRTASVGCILQDRIK